MEKYTLEELSQIFGKHVEELKRSDHYKEGEFNLPLALKTMVDEVMDLKKEFALKQLNKVFDMDAG